MLQRQLLVRKDDEERQRKVREARDLIYKDNYVVDSVQVNELLKAESLVPTEVCLCIEPFVGVSDMRRMLFLYPLVT